MVINDLDIKTTTGTVVKWKGTASEVEIPTEVESRGKQTPVTTVGEYAFLGSIIHAVTLPDTITKLELGAFFNCRYMTSINLPDSLVSIGPDTFHGCTELQTITIPDAVTNIGNGAFDGCSNIEFKVGAGNKAYTSVDGSLYTKDMKQLIAIGSEKISLPDSVTTINESAFTGMKG